MLYLELKMGFNTVAFMLNDLMECLRESPKTVLHVLTHPPLSDSEKQQLFNHNRLDSIAKDNGEQGWANAHQALEVLPTFHADNQLFFMAGGNQILKMKALKLGMTKEGKKTITLELPDWFTPYNMFLTIPKGWPKKG